MNLYLTAIFVMFSMGFFCLAVSRNMIRMIIGVELMARAASFAFIYFGYAHGGTSISQSLVVTIIVIEVVVTAIALAMVMNLYKLGKSLDVRNLTKLRG